MSASSRRLFFLAAIAASIGFQGSACAADRAAFLAACEKERGAEAKATCACVAGKVDAAFKDKALTFAYQSLAQPIGELVQSDSGLSEKEEDDIVDKTFAFMKECGLVK
ncbi:MAG: hypothetical protein H6876_06980 [Hyphomicrobiaceae bacterium]|nr:hypothetical protein [Hyphomicrobiaceae bacterium]